MSAWRSMTGSLTGENRRYYKVTERGMAQLNLYHEEWKNYSRKISEIFEGGASV